MARDRFKELAQITQSIIMPKVGERNTSFYGMVLLGLNKKFSASIPTACVSKKPGETAISLYWGEEFWDKLNFAQRKEITLHEMLHICFFHFDIGHLMPDNNLRGIAVD